MLQDRATGLRIEDDTLLGPVKPIPGHLSPYLLLLKRRLTESGHLKELEERRSWRQLLNIQERNIKAPVSDGGRIDERVSSVFVRSNALPARVRVN